MPVNVWLAEDLAAKPCYPPGQLFVPFLPRAAASRSLPITLSSKEAFCQRFRAAAVCSSKQPTYPPVFLAMSASDMHWALRKVKKSKAHSSDVNKANEELQAHNSDLKAENTELKKAYAQLEKAYAQLEKANEGLKAFAQQQSSECLLVVLLLPAVGWELLVVACC